MKKLLSVLLATATVFSTTAFASPAAEPIESADEISLEVEREAISSKTSDASLTAENALNSNYDDELGLKLVDEDFEDLTVGNFRTICIKDGVKTSYTDLIIDGQYPSTISEEGDKQTLSVVKDTVGDRTGTFIKSAVNKDCDWAANLRFYSNDGTQHVNSGAGKYTVVFDTYHTVKTGNAKCFTYDAVGALLHDNYTVNETEKWETKTISLTKNSLSSVMLGIQGSTEETTVYYDNVRVYYKPSGTADYGVASIKYPTVNVIAPDGIESSFAKAMTENPAKYFGENVVSCDIKGNAITLTVNAGGKITLPEAVNGKRTKLIKASSVNVEKVDALAPWRGIKVIDENFESFTVGETYGTGDKDYKPHGNRTYATEGAGTTAELVENVKGIGSGKYVRVNIGTVAGYPSFKILLDNNGGSGSRIEEYITVPATFTMSSNLYFIGDDFAKGIAARPAMLLSPYALPGVSSTTFSTGSWQNLVKTYTQPSEGVTAQGLYWVFANSSKTAGTIYIDDIKLYYKPAAADAYTDISIDFPTITLTAANGFEANALAAIEANPAEYLSSAVESVEFADNKMIINLDMDKTDNFGHITVPALVNASKTATYPETKIELPDYYAPLYGLRNYLWNAGNKSVENTDIVKNPDYFKSYSFNRSAEGFDYISLVTGAYQWPHSLNYWRDTTLPYNTDYTYTYITKSRFSGVTSCILRRVDSTANDYNKIDIGKRTDNTWNEIKFEDYTIEAGHTVQSAQPDLYVGSDVYSAGKGITADVAYIALYYRPKATSSDYTTKFSGNTVTVTYANGIDKDTAEALETYYGKYFGGNVTALTVNGNDVVMTLKDGVTEVTVPKLVNADGSATYDEVIVNTAVAPTSLAEETTIRATYPAGLRFKAAVKSKFMEDKSLTEFGYIVARAEKLGGAELTANMTSVKTIVSPSFKRVDGEVTINKYEVGTDNTTFAAVLVNIPNTNYGDKFAVRPYVVYGGEYYYGDTMKASILEVAESLKDGATGDVLEVVNKIIKGEALPEYKG